MLNIKRITPLIPIIPALATAFCSLHAADLAVGPRAQGMAGANVASTNDATAQFYNPGALGFFRAKEDGEVSENDNHALSERDFDLNVDLGAGYRMTGDIGTYLQRLADIDITALSTINSGSGINAQQLNDIVSLVGIFTKIADEGNNVLLQTTGGMNLRVKNFAIGVRGFGDFVARVNSVDTNNLGFSFANIGEFNTALTDAGTTIVPGGYTNQHITSGGALEADLIAAGLTTTAITTLDYQIGQGIASGLLDANDVTEISGILETVASTIGTGGDINNNTTAILISGVGYVEIPVTYGHAFNDHFAIGVSGKLMIGRHYGAEVLVFDDGADQILDNITEDFQESETIGIDIGIMGRVNNFQIGLTGRNLNSPRFEGFTTTNGFTFQDFTIDPTITLGVAWVPRKTMTVEVDIDLSSKNTGISSYETQNIAVGAEWIVLNILALRAGTYLNIAEDEIGAVFTAGVGLNLAVVSIDLAVALSPETVEYDGSSVPEEAAFSFGLSGKF